MLTQIRLRTVLVTAITVIVVAAVCLIAVMSWRYQTLAHDSLAISIVTVITGLALGVLLGYAGWLIHLTVKAGVRLHSSAKKITSGEPVDTQQTRFPEINSLMDTFKVMTVKTVQLTEQLAAARAALADEVSERQHSERLTHEQELRLCAVQNVAALSATLSFDEHIGEILRVGCRLLELESAVITQIHITRNEGVVVGLVASPHHPLHCGSKLPLNGTLCEHAFDAGTLAIHHASLSKWALTNAFYITKEESHIETVIYVNGAKYGTISFASTLPRKEPYRDTDIELVKLLGRLAGITIEREIMRSELVYTQNQSESSQRGNKFDVPRHRPKSRSSLLEPFIQ